MASAAVPLITLTEAHEGGPPKALIALTPAAENVISGSVDYLALVDPVGPHLRNVFPKRSIRELASRPDTEWVLRTHANVTKVNLDGAKNQVGLIRQPACVVVDPEFLGTLPDALRPADVDETPKRGDVPRTCATPWERRPGWI